jgi:hypothetical protein
MDVDIILASTRDRCRGPFEENWKALNFNLSLRGCRGCDINKSEEYCYSLLGCTPMQSVLTVLPPASFRVRQ